MEVQLSFRMSRPVSMVIVVNLKESRSKDVCCSKLCPSPNIK
ncbi:hypothetical protein C5167_041632, partial [Papaver somniferum]